MSSGVAVETYLDQLEPENLDAVPGASKSARVILVKMGTDRCTCGPPGNSSSPSPDQTRFCIRF